MWALSTRRSPLGVMCRWCCVSHSDSPAMVAFPSSLKPSHCSRDNWRARERIARAIYHMYRIIANDSTGPCGIINQHGGRVTSSNLSSKRLGANQTRGARGIVVVYSGAPHPERATYRHIYVIASNDSTGPHATRASSVGLGVESPPVIPESRVTEYELARGNKGAYSFIPLVRVDKGWRERASCTMREKSACVPRPRVARSLVGYMSMSATVGCFLVVPVKQARLME